ncbi:MAG: hypothetical protein ACLQFR_09465 [Streptosporangiaceae bacterium]
MQSTQTVEGSANGQVKSGFDFFTRHGTDQARRAQADALSAWMAEHPEATP